MYDKIFKRIEQKYLLSYDEYNNLFNLIDKYLEKDKFYESKVCNLYFDTYNNDLIINSIEKPIYKEKVRVRSYGTAKDDDFVFLEIKTLESFSLWLVHALSDFKIYPQSFSKYGNIYKREIIERECEAYV